MKKPTQEEIRKLWEWCGFQRGQFEPHVNGVNKYRYEAGWWMYPDDIRGSQDLPPIDLNNLFKYAVLRLQWFIVNFEHIEVSCDYYVTLTDFYLTEPCREYKSQHSDPALALFWAIWEVIKEEK